MSFNAFEPAPEKYQKYGIYKLEFMKKTVGYGYKSLINIKEHTHGKKNPLNDELDLMRR